MSETVSLNTLAGNLRRLTKNKLWLQVIIAIILGVCLGLILNPSMGLVSQELSAWLGNWLNLPGNVFLKLVQMIMIPLIFTSIITGIVSNDSENLKSIGLRLVLYFVATTATAIIIGLVLASLMSPGRFVYELGGFPNSSGVFVPHEGGAITLTNVPDAIINLIPNNPLDAMLNLDMLGVVVFTIIIGVAITQLSPELARLITRFAEAVQKICMIVVSWAMLLVPYAVFGLMAALLSGIGFEILWGLGYYIGVVILGLIFLVLFYMLVLRLFTKVKPRAFLKAIREPQLLAFSTASSAAVMPLSMKVADEKLGVSSRISDLVIPVGASINMDGTALFQCVSALFLAQAYGMELSIANLLLLTITIVAASIGTPAIPGGGVVILASVLQGMGIPTDGLIVIVGIDRILGMFRTTVNVTGDLTACVVFNTWFGKKDVYQSNLENSPDP